MLLAGTLQGLPSNTPGSGNPVGAVPEPASLMLFGPAALRRKFRK